MTTILKMVALILSLGMDTLMVSVFLGMAQAKGRWKIALTFATAEAIMPLIGFTLGRGTGKLVGHWASLLGGLALLALGVWFIFIENDDEEEKLRQNLAGWALVVTALSISLDELAVGFSIGLIDVPIALTITLIAFQAFLLTFFGLTFGFKLKPYLGEWSEKAVGIVLGLLGVWISVEAILAFLK